MGEGGGKEQDREIQGKRERECPLPPLPFSTQASREFDLGIKTDPNLRPYFAKLQFPALGLPIVPRTHFRTHRTRRWAPTNPACHSRRSQSGPPRTSIQPSRIGSSRLLEGVRDASSRRSRAVRTLGRTQISSDLR